MEPTYFFHVTPATRTAKIRREGLRTGRRSQWRTPLGAKQGDRSCIYLISDYSQAVRWAARMEWDLENAPIDIIKVRVDSAVEPDDHWENQMYENSWFKTRENVPKENIVNVRRLTLDMRKGVVNGGKIAEPDLEDEGSAPPSP